MGTLPTEAINKVLMASSLVAMRMNWGIKLKIVAWGLKLKIIALEAVKGKKIVKDRWAKLFVF